MQMFSSGSKLGSSPVGGAASLAAGTGSGHRLWARGRGQWQDAGSKLRPTGSVAPQMRNSPGAGSEPVSPAPAGRFTPDHQSAIGFPGEVPIRYFASFLSRLFAFVIEF